jgi:hypothetical protein
VHGVGLEQTENVHDHDVALPQGRNQDLLDVEKEGFAVIGASISQGAECDRDAKRREKSWSTSSRAALRP